jgi:hypothetical protein
MRIMKTLRSRVQTVCTKHKIILKPMTIFFWQSYVLWSLICSLFLFLSFFLPFLSFFLFLYLHLTPNMPTVLVSFFSLFLFFYFHFNTHEYSTNQCRGQQNIRLWQRQHKHKQKSGKAINQKKEVAAKKTWQILLLLSIPNSRKHFLHNL